MSTYHPNKLKPLAKIIARMVCNNPRLADPENEGLLMAQLATAIPNFTDKKHCLNCGASMAEYEMEFSILEALLLLSVGKIVHKNLEDGADFTEANKVRISAHPAIPHAQKCHTTQCGKLGLLAKSKDGSWAITSRGFEALAGKPVPKMRVTFRGQILERPEELTTLAEVFVDHRRKMEDLQKRGKSTRFDYRNQADEYDPSEWYHIGGYHEGALI